MQSAVPSTRRWTRVRAPFLAGRERQRAQEREGAVAEGEEPANGRAFVVPLALLGLGVGLAQVLVPDRVARLVGRRAPSPVERAAQRLGRERGGRANWGMRALGVREIVTGIGALAMRRRTGWMIGRVAGDVVDLVLLARLLLTPGTRRVRAAAATAGVLGVAALDWAAATSLTTRATGRREIRVRKSITVNRSPEEVYRFWHDFTNLPRFMRHLESVEVLGDGRSRWRAKAPAGASVSWEAVTTEDRPGEVIAWRSVGGDVENAGRVRFQPAPGGRGTVIHAELSYRPPGGRLTAALAKLFREEPGQQVQDDLRNFKQVMETGEVLLSDATVRRGPRPAQPPVRSGEDA